MKKKNGRVFWLVYIDSSVPRSRGRIIPRNRGVSKPTAPEVAKALERLGYKFHVFMEKKYPPVWYEERLSGYFVVETEENIRRIALKVAEEIRQMRS